MSLTGQAKPIWTGEKCQWLLRWKKCDAGREVFYSSVSYLADAARKWKIMRQIQEAQDPWNGFGLLQGFGSVSHVPSSISEDRNKN